MDFKVEKIFQANVLFEANVAIGGWTSLIIYGKHINGYFCSIPNWKWGCEMAGPNEVRYNSEKLEDCGTPKEIAQAIANAIQQIANNQ